MPIPDQLPAELVPPSSRDLNNSVDLVKDLLKNETRSRSPASLDAPISRLKNRSFNNSSPSLDSNRDATIYKHSDSEPPGGFYKPRNRHVDRDAIRSRDEDDSPTADLSDMKRRLANTAQMLERTAQTEASRTKEDEELDQEMDDLKYRVKRVHDDLDYNARPPRTSAKDEERRRLERELLTLMHERIPDVERKIKAREERREREKRQWARDRDRALDRDRVYRRERSPSRDPIPRRRERSLSRDAIPQRRERSRSRDPIPQRRERSRSRDPTPRRERSPSRDPIPQRRERSPSKDPIPQHRVVASPRPDVKKMTPAERQAFIKAEGQRLTQLRMAALGVTAPTTSPVLDTSVEDRLQQEKKEAEEKAKAAEKQAEERERARKERLENAKSLKEGKMTPTPLTPDRPAVTAPVIPKPTPKVAPPPPKPRVAPPPPASSMRLAPAPATPVPAPANAISPIPSLKKEAEEKAKAAERQAEERERARKERLEHAKSLKEGKITPTPLTPDRPAVTAPVTPKPTPKAAPPPPKPRVAPPPPASSTRSAPPAPAPVTPPAPVPATPPAPALATPVPSAIPPISSTSEKSTNPFSRLIKEGASSASPPSVANGSSNPWSRPPTAQLSDLAPSKSPVPNAVKTSYNTAPSSLDDDWDEIKENSDSDSSDDEITQSRAARANIAQQLFGNILPRPTSAAAAAPSPPSLALPSPASPSPAPPLPPPAPLAPSASAAPIAPVVAPSSNDVSALMQSIQGGMKLRPTKTVDRSAPPVSGRVLDDVAPPPHISATVESVSPVVQPRIPPLVSGTKSDRLSTGWFADRAADIGVVPDEIQRLPSTLEGDEEDIYHSPPTPDIPRILVDDPAIEPVSDLMADIDKSIRKPFLHE